MTRHSPLGSYVRRFLLEYLISDRGLSRNTQKGYRDVIRLPPASDYLSCVFLEIKMSDLVSKVGLGSVFCFTFSNVLSVNGGCYGWSVAQPVPSRC